MKSQSDKLLFLFLFAFIRTSVALAQAPVLPLQPEKLTYAREVEQEAITKKDSLLFAEAYYLYGKIYVAARDYLNAKSYYIKSLRIVEQRKQFDKVGRLYLRLAELESEQANGPKALEYARTALVYKRNGLSYQQISAYEAISKAYELICHDDLAHNRKNALEDSLFYYCNQTKRMADEYKDTLSLASINILLGKIYQLQQNPIAFQFYQTALKLFKAIDKKHPQVQIIQQMALAHLRFNHPDEAFPLIQESERMYKDLQIREFYNEQAFVDAYIQYYQQKGDWKKAFEQSQRARDYDHNRMIADRDGAVSQLSVVYETKKKEALLKSQQRELVLSQVNQKTQRRFLIVLSALLLGAAFASGAFYRLSRKNQRLSLHNANLVREQNHRVKNNLQLISSLLSLQSNRLADENAKNAVEDSQRRIEVMSLLQRKLYDGDNLVSVHVGDFIRELTEMVLEAFDELDQVQTVYQIPSVLTLSADYVMRIGLIVNELITNACKYAFPDNPNPTLQIEAALDKNTVHLRVTDNGKGFDHSTAASKSFGMRLIQLQVEQLYGTYHFDDKGGTAFILSFPLLPASPKWQKS